MTMRLKAQLLMVCMVSTAVLADVRPFAFTYDYSRTPAGKWEVETYFTPTISDLNNVASTTTNKFQLEYEAGMEKFDVGLYQQFSQDSSGSVKYGGFKFRIKFPFAEEGKLPIDLMGYIEGSSNSNFQEKGVELKLIISKQVGVFRFAANPTLEAEFAESNKIEPELSLGAAYRKSTLGSIGFESKISEDGLFIGPTISHGIDGNWIALGTLFKLVDGEEKGGPDFQIRLIWGLAPQ